MVGQYHGRVLIRSGWGLICGLSLVDDFVKQLWEIYKDVREEGILQVQQFRLKM